MRAPWQLLRSLSVPDYPRGGRGYSFLMPQTKGTLGEFQSCGVCVCVWGGGYDSGEQEGRGI